MEKKNTIYNWTSIMSTSPTQPKYQQEDCFLAFTFLAFVFFLVFFRDILKWQKAATSAMDTDILKLNAQT